MPYYHRDPEGDPKFDKHPCGIEVNFDSPKMARDLASGHRMSQVVFVTTPFKPSWPTFMVEEGHETHELLKQFLT